MNAESPAVAQLLEFLRFPSISTIPENTDDVNACAEWLATSVQQSGFEVRLCPTRGNPVLIAKNRHRPDRRTVLIYGHYDVQPVDPLDQWISPPFSPRVENGVIFARGAADNKGQIFAHICGMAEALADTGELPVNVIVLVEGEEEIGSPSLGEFLQEHREELRCDIVVISDSGMVAPGVPTLSYGLRGIAMMEVKVSGPSTDLHSGLFGGIIDNPAAVLVRLLASLRDENDRIAVEGFYDNVQPLAQWERDGWAQLPVSEASIQALTQVPALGGEAGFNFIERLWARPTAEINGIWGGFQGTGSKTIIPREASVKLSFRLVPHQLPAEVCSKVSAHLRKLAPPTVKLEIVEGHEGEPYLTNPHSPMGRAAQRALSATFGRDPVFIREGASIPIVNTLKRVLGAETLLLGLALPDCRAHAPNENFPLENFFAGIRLNRALLEELA